MTDTTTTPNLDDALEAALENHRLAAAQVAMVALTMIRETMNAHYPDAEFIRLDWSDQSFDGQLVAVGYRQDHEDHDFDDEHDDVFAGAFSNLYDGNRSIWEPYLVEGVERRGGPSPMSMAKLNEFVPFCREPAVTIAESLWVRDPDRPGIMFAAVTVCGVPMTVTAYEVTKHDDDAHGIQHSEHGFDDELATLWGVFGMDGPAATATVAGAEWLLFAEPNN